jgi:glutamine synthetase
MTSFIAKTMILPAALRYQKQIADTVAATKAAGTEPADEAKFLGHYMTMVTDLHKAADKLDKALHHHAEGDILSHAKHARDSVLASMSEVRKTADKLETVVADDLWPLPTYREMLFIK